MRVERCALPSRAINTLTPALSLKEGEGVCLPYDETVKCQVLLFAQLREAVGRDRLAIDLPDGATVGDALDLLCRQHDAIAALRGRIAVAVDETYRPMNFSLRDGYTIALIPPVSGG